MYICSRMKRIEQQIHLISIKINIFVAFSIISIVKPGLQKKQKHQINRLNTSVLQ